MCSYSATHAFTIELPILISRFYQALEVQDFGYETDLIRVSLAEHCSAHGFQHISEQTRKLPQCKFKRGLSCENATTPASHSQPAPQLPTTCLAAHSSQMPDQALMASQHRSCLQPSWLHSSQMPEWNCTSQPWPVSTEAAFNLLGLHIAASCQQITTFQK